jgi:hypothetical protein
MQLAESDENDAPLPEKQKVTGRRSVPAGGPDCQSGRLRQSDPLDGTSPSRSERSAEVRISETEGIRTLLTAQQTQAGGDSQWFIESGRGRRD